MLTLNMKKNKMNYSIAFKQASYIDERTPFKSNQSKTEIIHFWLQSKQCKILKKPFILFFQDNSIYDEFARIKCNIAWR